MTDKPTQPLPTITGDPKLDSLLRSGILIASGWVGGAIVGWLNARGFTDPDIAIYVTGAVAAVMTALAAGAWGVLSVIKAKLAVDRHTDLVAGVAVQIATRAQAPVSEHMPVIEQKAAVEAAKTVVNEASSEKELTRRFNLNQLQPATKE